MILISVLKIIGIVTGCTAALLLFLLLLLCLSPIRYRGISRGEGKSRDLFLSAGILFHVLRAYVSYHEEQGNYAVLLFGRQIYPRRRPVSGSSVHTEAQPSSAEPGQQKRNRKQNPFADPARFRKILLHIRPVRGKGMLRFGFSEPSSTALAYAFLAHIAAMIDKRLQVIPDMENRMLDFDFSLKGKYLSGFELIRFVRFLIRRSKAPAGSPAETGTHASAAG